MHLSVQNVTGAVFLYLGFCVEACTNHCTGEIPTSDLGRTQCEGGCGQGHLLACVHLPSQQSFHFIFPLVKAVKTSLVQLLSLKGSFLLNRLESHLFSKSAGLLM